MYKGVNIILRGSRKFQDLLLEQALFLCIKIYDTLSYAKIKCHVLKEVGLKGTFKKIVLFFVIHYTNLLNHTAVMAVR